MPSSILFVHGYSESSLGTYNQFPQVLAQADPAIAKSALAAFDSLDDSITIDDLADAMETRVAMLESQGWVLSDVGVICHSTGALIARRWILNRLAAGKPIPSHLITLAGANHGSTLAHMGKTPLGYLQKLLFHHELSVGQGVLTDLEYGSDFLLRLSAEWMKAWNDGSLDGLYAFSVIGDTPGTDPTLQIFWQTHEDGSDNTVRISGGNLNYTMIDVSHDENETTISAVTPARRVPHVTVPNYTHFGPQTGIMTSVTQTTDAPVQRVVQALSVKSAADYAALEAQWTVDLAAWTAANPNLANSTAIFTLLDRNGSSIDDCMIAILDQATLGDAAGSSMLANPSAFVAAASTASKSLVHSPPLQNDQQQGSYTFYINYAAYTSASPHWFQIEINNDALLGQHKYPYPSLIFTQPPNLTHTIAPNECTYVKLTMGRDTDVSYAIYAAVPTLNMTLQFPPFDPADCLAP
jgi:hypothetical protein